MSTRSMYGTQALHVVKLMVQQTGTFNPQVRRPYMVNPNSAAAIESIGQVIQRTNKLTPGNFVPNSESSLVIQSPTPESYIEIANGWNTPRLRFILQLQEIDQMQTATNIYVSGYTEYADLSYNGHFDQRMKFFVNHITSTRTAMIQSGTGLVPFQNVIGSDHVLMRQGYQSALHGGQIYSQAPENVFANWENVELMAGAAPEGEPPTFIDARMNLTGQPIKSSRANAIAPIYSSKILQTYLQMQRGEPGIAQAQLLDYCQTTVRADDLGADPFVRAIMSHRQRTMGYMSTSEGFDNTFTIQDLIAIDPNTPNVTSVNGFTEGTHYAGQTANWNGSDQASLTATMLAQSIPSYMSAVNFNFIDFHATNHTVDGTIQSWLTRVDGWNNGLDQSRQAEVFIFRVTNELLKGLTFNNQLSFKLFMVVDLLGETWITLSLNNEPDIVFVAPTFADALAVPVVTTDINNLNGITLAMSDAMQQLWENGNDDNRALSLSGNIHI